MGEISAALGRSKLYICRRLVAALVTEGCRSSVSALALCDQSVGFSRLCFGCLQQLSMGRFSAVQQHAGIIHCMVLEMELFPSVKYISIIL